MVSKRAWQYLGFALAGGAVGAVVGLLTAPASGYETRRRLTERIDEEKEALLSSGNWFIEEVRDYVSDPFGEERKLA
jgi:gas vesicle protein